MLKRLLAVFLFSISLKLSTSQDVEPVEIGERNPYVGVVNNDNENENIELNMVYDMDSNDVQLNTLFIAVATHERVEQVLLQFEESGPSLNFDDSTIATSYDGDNSYFGIYLSYNELLDYTQSRSKNFDINQVNNIIITLPQLNQVFVFNIIWIPWWHKKCCNDANQLSLPCPSRQCIVWSSWWWGPYIYYNYSPWGTLNFHYPCFNKPWWYCFWFPKVKKCYTNAANVCDCKKQFWEYYPPDCYKNNDCPTSVPTNVPTTLQPIPTPKPTLPTPNPTMPTPQPIIPTLEPTLPTPKPTQPTPQPILPTPEPTIPTPKPTEPTPKPTLQPTLPTPKPTEPTPQPILQHDSCCPKGVYTTPDYCPQFTCLNNDGVYYPCKSLGITGSNGYDCVCSAPKPTCCEDVPSQVKCQDTKCFSNGVNQPCKWDSTLSYNKCFCP